MKVRLKRTFDAVQWLKDGDGGISVAEAVHGPDKICDRCNHLKKEHGGHLGWVCPGDWIVDIGDLLDYQNQGVDNFRPDMFKDLFEAV